ncbi:MAG TPA: ABC transporter permease [Bosea sp. (in: a-proteobacteria)]|jgi:putative ABC transport system permease protein|uniref:ABC transporter permease n=1 Tax=Bosea sp. (in: a-proteobacteria) TaxID=1871050 RepID=UPI002E0E4F08|nr:ABC transporter permease [Bosea sp. (in: a-proteobacteria)]
MPVLALKILFGDRAKLLGLVFGVAFATLLVMQQGAMFVGLMTRSQNVIAEAQEVDIWVMEPSVEYLDLVRPMRDGELFKVRGVPGVAWAAPFFKGTAPVRTPEGRTKNALILGVDDTTLIGATRRFLVGSPEDLQRPDAIAIDRAGFAQLWPGEPLAIGKTLELNDRRAIVIAITDAAPAFSAQVIIYARYTQALNYLPTGRNQLSFILAKAEDGITPAQAALAITDRTGLKAYASDEFSRRTIQYYLRNTGIPMSFATTILLGILVGGAIVGLTFNMFVSDNLPQYAMLKVVGVTDTRLAGLVLLQAAVVGAIGYAIGTGLAAAFFEFACTPTSALRGFVLPWWIALGVAGAMSLLILLSTIVSLRRVFVVEPATIFRG